MKAIRLDKYLADMGKGTRSEIKNWIRKGLVKVDGSVVKKPEQKIQPDTSVVMLRDETVCYTKYEYLLLYKPAGCVSATKDNLHKTVLDFIESDHKKELFPVGRLDLDTEGLLLLTNDGVLAHALLSPSHHVEKTYYAKLDHSVTPEMIQSFQTGLDIGEKKITQPAKLKAEGQCGAYVTITEGKFHQVKRMFHAVGCEVLFLKRISMGPLKLDDTISPGNYRSLTEQEILQLYRHCGLEKE
ncbi:MAG: pseudouridine synthase [Lachnospiraceae bacterium]